MFKNDSYLSMTVCHYVSQQERKRIKTIFKVFSSKALKVARFSRENFKKVLCARLLNSGISSWGHVIDTKVEYCFRCNSCIQLLNALEAGKAPARRRIHNWSCGQNSFASEDQRLWTEGKKIIAFGFFLFHRWKSTDRAGAIPVFKTCVYTERNCTRSETFANRTYYTASQLMNENCSIL